LKKELSDTKLDRLCEEFSALVVEKVIASDYLPGAVETLHLVKDSNIDAYIVSGTPQKEIELIVTRKGLTSYFLEIHGSPRKKYEIVEEILQRRYYDPSACLFIGDAMSDYRAAKKNNMRFIGIVPLGKDKEGTVFPVSTTISNVIMLP